MKTFKWILALGVLAVVGWIAFKWYMTQQGTSMKAMSLVPADAIYCIVMEDPIHTWKEVSGSQAWNHLQGNAKFASLTSAANSLDSLIRQNDLLFDLIGSRTLLISAHMTGFKQYDFLFLVDLQKASGIKFLNEYLTDFSGEGITVGKESYNGENLITVHDASNNTNLYLSFPGSFLVASYNRKIVASAIDASLKSEDAPANNFLTVQPLSSGSMMTVYLNYDLLPKFVGCYSNEATEYASGLAKSLRTTTLDITLQDELLQADGQTSLRDSVPSYITTLARSGKSPAEFPEIAPQRTAFALGLGFESFATFFANLEKNLQQDVAEYKTYRENLRQAENYLNIDLQRDLVSWIGDEVALLDLQSSGKGLNNETALVLKASNIGAANQALDHIEKMVRRKTPVKFKTVDYRGYGIRYLSMKGLFHLLLGKFFARYDKPYYTIVDNFVVFSNHPQTLESIIDDYLARNTLSRSEEFRTFRKQFEDESSVFIYLQTPVLFATLKNLADDKTRVSMEENRPYIECFRHVGFQLVPGERGFRTLFAEKFVQPDIPLTTVDAQVSTPDSTQTNTVIEEQKRTPEDTDPMALPDLYVKNPNAKTHREYFADSTVHAEVDLKNGFKDGDFTEYYPNGEVRMSGHFNNDKRDGTWKLYDENGKLVLKRVYDDNEIRREKTKD